MNDLHDRFAKLKEGELKHILKAFPDEISNYSFYFYLKTEIEQELNKKIKERKKKELQSLESQLEYLQIALKNVESEIENLLNTK